MNPMVNLRRGEGPFWGKLKWLVKRVQTAHIPVFRATKPLFYLLNAVRVVVRVTAATLVRFFWDEPLFRSQCAIVGRGFRMVALPIVTGSGRIVIGDRVNIRGRAGFHFDDQAVTPPELIIGDDTYLGNGCGFSVTSSVRIGKHCLLADGVQISDFDGHPLDAARRRIERRTPPEGIGPVVIGNDVWIGFRAIILKGVRIGDRAVIGAGAVVARDVPPDSVAAGNPARVIRQLGEPHLSPQ